MRKQEIQKVLPTIALVVAVIVAIPLIAVFAILFRAAGVILVAGALAGLATAATLSPEISHFFRSLIAPEEGSDEESAPGDRSLTGRRGPGDYVKVTATVVAVIVAIPILFLLAFVYRFALFTGVAMGLIGGMVAIAVSPSVRGRIRSMIDPEVEYKGMRLATEVGLGQGHLWARVARDGAFVGVDDLAAKCLGPVDQVQLPAIGQEVRHGEPLFSVAHGNRRIEARSPVDGTVLTANEELHADPQRVNRDPYGLGWIVRMRSTDPSREKKRLLRGADSQRWFRHEVDELVSLVGGSEQPAMAMADGGQLVDSISKLIDEPTWEQLKTDFFNQDGDSFMEVES